MKIFNGHLVLSIIMISKSIILHRGLITVTVLWVFICLTNKVVATHLVKHNYKQREILDDLPLKRNIYDYLMKLEKIYYFVDKHKHNVDINFAFGLFLVNVNLRTVLAVKGQNLPENIKTSLDQVLRMNDDIMEFYQNMMRSFKNVSGRNERARDINTLFFGNEYYWTNHLQKFKTDLLMKTEFFTRRDLINKYSKWSSYKHKVFDFESYIPDPETSDICISALANNPVNAKMEWVRCKIPYRCLQTIINGTNFGYAMTHRLLYLIMVRFSRGCTITTASKDKQQIDNFCAKIYNEAEYLAYQNFQIPDLFLEQISLCTLEGHAQFLRRSWIEELLEYQTELGCLGTSKETDGKKLTISKSLQSSDRQEWRLLNDDQEILGSLCNTHTTGAAAAVLSAIIRFIMEKFY